MKWGIIILCLSYSLPACADELSELKEQVAILQEQVLKIQYQLDSLVGEKGERPIEATSYEGTEVVTPRREPRARFKVKPGYNALSYQAEGGGIDWRENSSGFGTSAELDVKVLKPLSFNLTFDGAIMNGTETLLGTFIGINQFSDTRIRLYTGSPNIRYRVLESERVSADMSLGYEFVGAQVRIRNTRTVSSLGLSESSGRENDNFFGHGPRIGIVTKFQPAERLSFGAEGFYSSFFDATWDAEDVANSKRHTEAHAFRWDLGAEYAVTKRISIGGGYRGYLLHTDLSKVRLNTTQAPFPETDTRSDLIYFSAGIKY